jgi:hypothetical protein
MSLRRHRRAAAQAAPRPAFVPRNHFVGKNYGRPVSGRFGPASKPKIFDAAQRREIEARLRAEGRM